MAKGPADRVNDTFTKDDQESIAKYLDWVRSTILDYSQSLRRSATALVFAAAIFEIITYSKNGTISISSFVIARNSLVVSFLPVLVGYFFLQITSDQNRTVRLLLIYSATFKLWSEKGAENDLATPLLGSTPLYWDPFSSYYNPTNIYKSDKIADFGSFVLMITIFFGVVAFESQAYYVLFTPKSPGIISWAISLCISVFCLIVGMAVFFFQNAD